MTYCVAMHLADGLVFISDSRTNAGIDQISTFRKLFTFSTPGERLIVLQTAGNLATSQSVVNLLKQRASGAGTHLLNVRTLYDATVLVAETIREVVTRDRTKLAGKTDLSCSFLRGERPTVERVRLELGRGSPARVGGLLDQWWSRLAERLSGETRLPALPSEVAQAFVMVWQQAIHLAQGAAEQALAEQRQVLDAERERVAAVEDQARQYVAQFRQQAAEAAAGRQAVELRLADLELLLAQRQTQIEGLQQQREGWLHERGETQQLNQTLQQDLRALGLKAEQERVAQEAYIRGVEDRAHREVDHARGEGKAMTAQFKTVGRQVEQLRRRLESIQAELSQTQQSAAAQHARADTLEQQLTQLHQGPSTKHKPRTRKTRALKTDP